MRRHTIGAIYYSHTPRTLTGHTRIDTNFTGQITINEILPHVKKGLCIQKTTSEVDNCTLITRYKFDVHRAVDPNIISIVKPTRCPMYKTLFYFRMTLCMFRTVFPSIIRRSRLHLSNRYCCLLAKIK